jgi:hypothetical protein
MKIPYIIMSSTGFPKISEKRVKEASDPLDAFLIALHSR